MKTLNLEQAAAFLHMHPYTVMQKANAGEIPGAKPGKRWVFIEDDLAEYLRGQYRVSIAVSELAGATLEPLPKFVNFKKQYLDALGLSDCPQIHSPQPAARSGASHADAARQVA